MTVSVQTTHTQWVVLPSMYIQLNLHADALPTTHLDWFQIRNQPQHVSLSVLYIGGWGLGMRLHPSNNCLGSKMIVGLKNMRFPYSVNYAIK